MQSPTMIMAQLQSLKLSNQTVRHGNLKMCVVIPLKLRFFNPVWSCFLPCRQVVHLRRSQMRKTASACEYLFHPHPITDDDHTDGSSKSITVHHTENMDLTLSLCPKTELSSNSLPFVTVSQITFYFKWRKGTSDMFVLHTAMEKDMAQSQTGEVEIKDCIQGTTGVHLSMMVSLLTCYPDIYTGIQALTIAVMELITKFWTKLWKIEVLQAVRHTVYDLIPKQSPIFSHNYKLC